MTTGHTKEAVSQPWSEEGSGDFVVAPEATSPEEFEAAKANNAVEKMDETALGKLTTHQKLNARSADIIPAPLYSESSTTSSDSVETTVTVKAASEATTHQLGRIPKLSLPLMAESSQGDSQSSMESTASNGSLIPVDESNSPRPPAPSSGSNAHRGGGPPHGASRGASGHARGGGRVSSQPSTSAAAYSTVAATTRNFLIHVYKSRDDLVAFDNVDDFNKIRDEIKTSLWSFLEEHRADRNLSVKNWAFHREKNIGLIFCTSEARQKRIISHIIDIGLGGHVVETEHDLVDGMKMSFKMPACFESKQMATLIEAIFVLNNLAGHCGHRELRTDRPKHGSPYTVCTVHFQRT
jgi:hypothetical protein